MSLPSLFLAVVNMSITAGWMTLAVLLLRVLLRGFPRVFSYLLWLVVYIRLLCPVSFTSAASLLGLFRHSQELSIPVASAEATGVALPASSIAWATDAQRGLGTYLPLLSFLWLVGFAGMLLYGLGSYLHLQKAVRRAEPVRSGVCQSEVVEVPFVLGIFHPTIYLPTTMTSEEYGYILQHERVHLWRRDYLVKPIAYLALCLHWFNPLVWFSFRLMTCDMEMSCDETVLRQLGTGIKKSYSASLLRMAAEKQPHRLQLLAFGETDTKRRIKNVLQYKYPMKKRVAVAICLVGALSLALLANPKAVVHANGGAYEAVPPIAIEPASEPTPIQIPASEPDRPAEANPGAIAPIPLYGAEDAISLQYIFPSGGYLAAGFYDYQGHTGADFAAPAGTEILAAQGGTVVYVSHEVNWPHGKYIILDHGAGWQTLYAHCSTLLVAEGDEVVQGDPIATVGRTGNATGNHCHLELRYGGEVVNPVDYMTEADRKAHQL